MTHHLLCEINMSQGSRDARRQSSCSNDSSGVIVNRNLCISNAETRYTGRTNEIYKNLIQIEANKINNLIDE